VTPLLMVRRFDVGETVVGGVNGDDHAVEVANEGDMLLTVSTLLLVLPMMTRVTLIKLNVMVV